MNYRDHVDHGTRWANGTVAANSRFGNTCKKFVRGDAAYVTILTGGGRRGGLMQDRLMGLLEYTL